MKIITPTDIKKLGTILSVWAHPDDESYCCAGIMATAVQNGQTVACVTATKGEQGVQDESRWPQKHLAEIRAKEMAEAMSILGVKHHHWLGYPDGGCADVPAEQAVAKIRSLIDQYKPDTVLTFGPEGMTGHPDHCSVSRWVSQATKGTDIAVYHNVQTNENYQAMREADEQFDIFYNIDHPPLYDAEDCDIGFNLPDDTLDKKYQCLCAMPSQTEAMFKQFGQDVIGPMVCCEAFIKANRTTEN